MDKTKAKAKAEAYRAAGLVRKQKESFDSLNSIRALVGWDDGFNPESPTGCGGGSMTEEEKSSQKEAVEAVEKATTAVLNYYHVALARLGRVTDWDFG